MDGGSTYWPIHGLLREVRDVVPIDIETTDFLHKEVACKVVRFLFVGNGLTLECVDTVISLEYAKVQVNAVDQNTHLCGIVPESPHWHQFECRCQRCSGISGNQ